jgi:hypothetical protein
VCAADRDDDVHPPDATRRDGHDQVRRALPRDSK